MNIRIDLNTNIADGSEVVFRSPADCSHVTGLVIYHNGGKTEFAFADAHGNNVGDIDHLFAENAVVKVILDVTTSMAFVQNADTNAYIERTFVKTVNGQAPDKKGNVKVTSPEGGNGSDGYTPVRGEDYFTPEDVEDIVSKASVEAKAAAVDEALSIINAPMLQAKALWYAGLTDEEKTQQKALRATITEIQVCDSFTTSVEGRNVDVENEGRIKSYVIGTKFIIAGDGSGRIMANPDSLSLFQGFSSVTKVTGLDVIDTRYVTTLQQAFAGCKKLVTVEGYENWDVRKVSNFVNLFATCTELPYLDLSRWDVSTAVAAAKASCMSFVTNPAMGKMFNSCTGLNEIRLNKSFDMRHTHLPIPGNDYKFGWMDIETMVIGDGNAGNDNCIVANGSLMYKLENGVAVDSGEIGGDGLVNPAVVGRTVTYVAVNTTPVVVEGV